MGGRERGGSVRDQLQGDARFKTVERFKSDWQDQSVDSKRSVALDQSRNQAFQTISHKAADILWDEFKKNKLAKSKIKVRVTSIQKLDNFKVLIDDEAAVKMKNNQVEIAEVMAKDMKFKLDFNALDNDLNDRVIETTEDKLKAQQAKNGVNAAAITTL